MFCGMLSALACSIVVVTIADAARLTVLKAFIRRGSGLVQHTTLGFPVRLGHCWRHGTNLQGAQIILLRSVTFPISSAFLGRSPDRQLHSWRHAISSKAAHMAADSSTFCLHVCRLCDLKLFS